MRCLQLSGRRRRLGKRQGPQCPRRRDDAFRACSTESASQIHHRAVDGQYFCVPIDVAVERIDATGARDAFAAGLAVAIAERRALPEAARFARGVAALERMVLALEKYVQASSSVAPPLAGSAVTSEREEQKGGSISDAQEPPR